jgi:hypothetical protein
MVEHPAFPVFQVRYWKSSQHHGTKRFPTLRRLLFVWPLINVTSGACPDSSHLTLDRVPLDLAPIEQADIHLRRY